MKELTQLLLAAFAAVTVENLFFSRGMGFDRILLMENLEPVFAGTFEELKKTRAYERWLAAE